MTSFTVPATGTYRTADGRDVRQFNAGAQIDVSDAVRFQIPGANEAIDSLAGIQEEANRIRDAGGGTLRLTPGRTYVISGPIILSSSTVLDARGATIRLRSGSNSNMLRSQATYGTGRDRDITVIGGLWDRGGNAASTPNAAHFVIMRKVDNLIMRDMAFVATSAKFCILIQNCTSFLVENIDCRNVPSDGVHVMGPARDGTIRNIGGTCGDDMVAIVPVDYTPYQWGDEGDVTDILIEDIHPLNTAKRAVCIVGGVTGGALGSGGVSVKTERIHVRSVSGTGLYYGIWIGGDVSNPGTDGGSLDDIVIEDVSFRSSVANMASVFLNGKDTRRVRIDGISYRTDGVLGQAAVLVDTPAVVQSLHVSNLQIVDGLASVGAISVQGRVGDLIVSQVSGTPVAAASLVKLNVAAGGSGITSAITRLLISDVSLSWASISGSLVSSIVGGPLLPLVELLNIAFGTNPSWLLDVNAVTQLLMANVSGGGQISVRAAGQVTVRAGTTNLSGGNSVAAGGVLRSKSLSFAVDLALLAQTANDMATNTNAALACGAGPVVSNGTAWKHLYSGLTYP